jgi:hypothetical protein
LRLFSSGRFYRCRTGEATLHYNPQFGPDKTIAVKPNETAVPEGDTLILQSESMVAWDVPLGDPKICGS